MEKRRQCSFGAISPLFHNILLSVFRFSCLKWIRFSLRDKGDRDNESPLYTGNVIAYIVMNRKGIQINVLFVFVSSFSSHESCFM